jgi:hypothetical protein
MKTIAAVAGTFLILSTAAAVASEPENESVATCRYRYERVQEKVDRVIAKYGADSGHALKAKEKLAEVHEWCWRRYKGWWDENGKTWRSDHW